MPAGGSQTRQRSRWCSRVCLCNASYTAEWVERWGQTSLRWPRGSDAAPGAVPGCVAPDVDGSGVSVPARSPASPHRTCRLLSGSSLRVAAVGSAVPTVPLKSSGLQGCLLQEELFELSSLFREAPLSVPVVMYLRTRRGSDP